MRGEESQSEETQFESNSSKESSSGEAAEVIMGEAILGIDVVKDLKSTCTQSVVGDFFKAISFGGIYMIRCPTSEEQACYPGENEVGVYLKIFEHGLRFPLDPFIVELLVILRVTISQLYPDSIFLIVAFVNLYRQHNVRLTIDLLQYFFTKKDKKDSSGVRWITLCACHGRVRLTGFPSSIKY